MIVKRDEIGLYVTAGGYVVRPVSDTDFRQGEKVATYFRSDVSVIAGVGKDETCGRNEYLETWLSTGIISWKKKDIPMEEQETRWEEEKKSWFLPCRRINFDFGRSSTGKWMMRKGGIVEI